MSLSTKRKEGSKGIIVKTQTAFDYDIIYDTDRSYDVIEYASRAIMDFLRKIAEDARKAGFNVEIRPDYQNLLLDIRVKDAGKFEDFLNSRIDEYNKLWEKTLDEIRSYMRSKGITGTVEDMSDEWWEMGLTVVNPNSATAMHVRIYQDADKRGNYIMGMLRKTTVVKPETPINKEKLEQIADYFIFGNDNTDVHTFKVTEGPRGIDVTEE